MPVLAVATAPSVPGSAAAPGNQHCGLEDAPQRAPGEIRDGVIVADQTKAAAPRRNAARAQQVALSARASRNTPTSTCGVLRAQMQQTLREGQLGELAAAHERADAGDKR